MCAVVNVQVWRGGEVSRYVPGQLVVDKLRDITEHELKHKTFGEPPGEPLLGHYFSLPARPERQDRIVLDDSMATVSQLASGFLRLQNQKSFLKISTF